MNHREWVAGSKVMDKHGFFAKLLAPTWNGFAWIVYHEQTTPVTVNADDLVLARTPTEIHTSCR